MVAYSIIIPMFVVVILFKSSSANRISCGQQLCGEVIIKYPFATGPDCSPANDDFAITCDNSSAYNYKPKPFLTKLKVELINLYYDVNQVTVKMRVIRLCASISNDTHQSSLNLSASPFVFDHYSNVFVSVGCHGNASMYNNTGQFISGCSPTCSPPGRVIDGCNGYHCCQADTGYPNYVEFGGVYSVRISGSGSGSGVGDSNTSCSGSAFLTSKALLQADNSTLAAAMTMTTDHFLVPVVLEYVLKPGPPGPHDLVDLGSTDEVELSSFLFLGFSVLGTLLLSCCCCWSCWRWTTKERRKETKLRAKYFKGILAEQRTNNVDKTKLFKVKELKRATDNFNGDRTLGEGSQGSVYKGMLKSGQVIAVKRGKTFEEKEWKQFINEVILLSQVKHRHVVKLLGCCLETKVPLLVYEFVSNGNLSQHVHNSANIHDYFSLTWDMRLRIASEVAGAIAYLHSSSSTPIYHRDVKSNNILLDENYEAKVADFGISRAISIDQTHLTTCVQGTFGYLDPEYFETCQFSEKSDVYSFGVVLVELLTGQEPIRATPIELEERSLVDYFISAMDRHQLDAILDPRVLVQSTETSTKDTTMSVAILAKRCLKVRGSERPTMKEVATELEGLVKRTSVRFVPQQGSLEIVSQSSMETSRAFTSLDRYTTNIDGIHYEEQPLFFTT